MCRSVQIMGCGASNTSETSEHDTNGLQLNDQVVLATESAMTGIKTEKIYQVFLRLDEDIYRLEAMCFGPRLATVEAWIEYLMLGIAQEMSPVNFNAPSDNSSAALVGGVRERTPQPRLVSTSASDKEQMTMVKLTLQLGVANSVSKAEKHEEFLASVSRSYLRTVDNELLLELIEHSKLRATNLSDSYNKLRTFYAEQDGLLTTITSGTYTSPKERSLDESLESARQIRDKLGAVAEQWRVSAHLLRTAAKATINASEYWSLVEHSKEPVERISLAIDCRHSIEQSVVLLEYAQKSLPQVEFAHVSARQISAVQHANVYLLTDMANGARYRHTHKVLRSFQMNLDKSVHWLHETFQKTIKTNLAEAERSVHRIAMQLRKERMAFIHSTVGADPYVAPEEVR